MKIVGITVGIGAVDESIWVNGIKLNAAMLCLAINKIGKYKAYVVDTSNKVEDIKQIKFWDTNIIPTVSITSIAKDLDVLIQLGTSLHADVIKALNLKKNVKIVRYQCGNNYVLEMERIIFKDPNEVGSTWIAPADQVWYVPQQGKHNHDYYSITTRTDQVFPVPFVWDPIFIERDKQAIENNSNSKVDYQVTGKPKRLTSFEPNMNVVKFSMPLILATEHAFRIGAEFNKLTICSGDNMFKSKYFLECLRTLDLYKNQKIQYLGRYPITRYLTSDVDIVLSHQWDNPLNYLYLDVLYFNYPLIHNADMVQDAGYYFKDFDMKNAGELIKHVIENHDSNLEEYKERNKPILERYTKENQGLLDLYDKLLENLFKPGKHKLSYEYDWKTNLYK
jgi:hypothetical protein